MPTVDVAALHDFPDGTAKVVQVDGHKIAVFHLAGTFYALDDTCSHADASLSQGELDHEEQCVECPMHGSLFDLKTGIPRTLPAFEPVATYPVTVVADRVVVEYSS